MKNTYLYILYHRHRRFFYGIILLIAGQAYFVYKGIETTPFFHYGMYSSAAKSIDCYSSIKTYDKNRQLILFDGNFSSNFKRYQLHFYHQLILNDSIDPIQEVITSRFGQNSFITTFFMHSLSNTTKDIEHFPSWFEHQIGYDSITFYQETYCWQGGIFECINRRILD